MNQTSFEAVKKHFYSIVQIPEREWRKFEVFLFSRSLKKGAYFIQEGDRCYDVGLITTGLIKRFLITEAGKEYVPQFTPDGDYEAVTYLPLYFLDEEQKSAVRTSTADNQIHVAVCRLNPDTKGVEYGTCLGSMQAIPHVTWRP